MSDLQKRLQLSQLPPMPPLAVGGRGRNVGGMAKRGMTRGKRDYSPVSWDNYFETQHTVKLDENNMFSVYESGTEGPACVFLHGGGYSGLSWAPLTKILTSLVTCRCVAIDLRGHGDTVTEDEENLSAENLSNDVHLVIDKLYGHEAPPIILIGHSMGGAIAVHTASADLIPTLIGLAVIDVVEGTALEALSSMQSFLRGRPRTFKSLQHAIEWSVRSGQTRNLDSARVSMVGQVQRITKKPGDATTGLPGSEGATNDGAQQGASSIQRRHHSSMDAIVEDSENSEAAPEAELPTATGCDDGASDEPPAKKSSEEMLSDQSISDEYTWRIDLSRTDVHWKGWFQGLSQLFLSCPATKLLLLAGVDRLDKDLMVGQMQGKFQMQVLPQCGHAVHEDVPDKVAEVLAAYMVRHKYAEPTANFHRP